MEWGGGGGGREVDDGGTSSSCSSSSGHGQRMNFCSKVPTDNNLNNSQLPASAQPPADPFPEMALCQVTATGTSKHTLSSGTGLQGHGKIALQWGGHSVGCLGEGVGVEGVGRQEEEWGERGQQEGGVERGGRGDRQEEWGGGGMIGRGKEGTGGGWEGR